MKLAISNLAWDFVENDNILEILFQNNIKYIEGVLTKIDSWDNLNTKKIIEYKKYLDSKDMTMESIQSIFYGLNCDGFYDTETIISHLENLCKYSKILGVKVLVLGSPSLRKKTNQEQLLLTFKKIDEILVKYDIEMSVEPNSKIYGGEFFFGLDEITKFIVQNNFIKIKTMIDTHNLVLEGYDPINEFLKNVNLVNHIHISEPNLSPISNHDLHDNFSKILKNENYNGIITYELNKFTNFDDTIKKFKHYYS